MIQEPIKVFSAFGGIECGLEAIRDLGIPVEEYVSSEIKPHAIAISRYVGQYPFYKDGDVIRRFTPIEVERLQTLPDDYTKYGIYNGVVKQVPDTHRYDCVGDGWTKRVIQHILSFIE